MEWAKLFVELIKAVAWPLALFGLGLVFRDDLKKLFPRVVRAGPTGFEFSAQKQIVATSHTGELREFPGIVRTATIAALEKKIHGELQVFNPDAHIDLLVRHLAQAQLQTAFERIYSIIFGSQIAGLRALADARGAILRSDAERFFEEKRDTIPELKNLNTTFDRWLKYLHRSDLLTDNGTEIEITDFGRDFLSYISATKGNEVRSG